jgi:DNA-binding SARP family transcriptional activator
MLMLQGFTRSVSRLLRLAVLAGMLAGVPYGLVTQVGWPLPETLPTSVEDLQGWLTTPVTDQMVINLLSVAMWILWVTFTASAAGEVIGALRGVCVPRLGGLAPMQHLAAWLLSGLTAGVLATAGLSPAASMPPADPAPVVQAEGGSPPATAAAGGSAPGPSTVTVAEPANPHNAVRWHRLATDSTPEQLIHEVARGDWMWHIAGRYLGDEHRYPEIAALNPELAQRRPGFPDHIQPGDRLLLPDDAHDGGRRRHAAGDTIVVSSSTGPATEPDAPDPPEPPAPPTASAEPAPHEAKQPDPTVEASTPPSRGQEPAGVPGRPSATAPTMSAPATPTETPPAGSREDGPEEPAEQPEPSEDPEGVALPSGAWISAGLAALIATVAVVLRLHQRRRHRIRTRPIPTEPVATSTPVPASLAAAETTGARLLDFDTNHHTLPGVHPAPPAGRAPIAITTDRAQVELFDLPGPIVALDGEGSAGALRAVLASALATGVSQHTGVQPRVVIPHDLLVSLLPDGIAPAGLDPGGEAFDGERLIVAADAASAVTRFEEEMIHRRRILDEADAESVTQLCQADEQPEHLPPYLLVVGAAGRYLPRVWAVATHRDVLDLHTVVLGHVEGTTNYQIEADGTLNSHLPVTTRDGAVVERLSTLTGTDLADVLHMLRQATPRTEAGTEPDDPLPAPAEGSVPAAIPAPSGGQAPPVKLRVLGPVRLETAAGPVTEGVRTGSLAVLALLAAHPEGRNMDEIVLTLDPATDDRPAARNRVRTDISALRTALRAATGLGRGARFITYDDRTRRYAIEADLVDVDLWRMLTAIQTANRADNDEEQALAALRQAADYYGGEFAADLEQVWTIGYATTTRNQVVSVWARIAEITEADQPDRAVSALEQAIDIDPVNEELYQRLMRIHGRRGDTDSVCATLRKLSSQLAEIGDTEPSQATQRVASRQLAGHHYGRHFSDEPAPARSTATLAPAPSSSTGTT